LRRAGDIALPRHALKGRARHGRMKASDQ